MNFRGLFAAVLLVLALQPIYFMALMAVDYVAPAERRAAHLAAAFETGELDREERSFRPITGATTMVSSASPSPSAWSRVPVPCTMPSPQRARWRRRRHCARRWLPP
jgi:hypothetical protein